MLPHPLTAARFAACPVTIRTSAVASAGAASPVQATLSPAASPPVTLDELRKYLIHQGMTGWYLPSRLEHVPALPRNNNGKVRKELLRRWLRGEADLREEEEGRPER